MTAKTDDDVEIFNAIDDLYDSDNSQADEDDKTKSRQHKRLLNDISGVTGVPAKRPALRSGPSSQVAEHLWSLKSGADTKGQVELHDLLESIPQTSSFGAIRKKIQKLERSKQVLDTPLEKPQVQKIQREIGYETNVKDISKWTATVIQNREAETLKFPMNAYEETKPTTKSVSVNFKPKNALEKEIAAVLKGSSSLLERNNKELTEEEEKALQAVDLQEAIERRKELQKIRALQSYYELKCRRTKRIKSKKFRRIQRKAEQKKEAKNGKELTEAEKSEMANDAENQRAMERAHLRHRNTSKWAKKIMTKDNKSLEEKKSLQEQLRISRQLTEQKIYDEEVEDTPEHEMEAKEFSLLQKSSDDTDNPWLLGGKTGQGGSKYEHHDQQPEVEDRALLIEKPQRGRSKNAENSNSDSDDDSDSESNDHIINHHNDKPEQSTNDSDKIENYLGSKKQVIKESVDPSSFKVIESKALDVDTFIIQDSDVDFASSNQESLIREAFANDHVTEEFQAEKKKVREERMPKSVDLSLPGWGEWAGAGIDNEKVLKRKKKKFVKVGKNPGPSQDEHLKHVIINEERNKKFAANQVSHVPFPYTSKAQFERSIRQPVGKTWNTPSLTAKLNQPRISTLMGTIIDPIKKVSKVKKDDSNNQSKNRKFFSNKKK